MKQISFDEALDITLTDRQVRLAQNGGKRQTVYTRREIEQSMLEAFDLIGGVPRLALWANSEKNYGEFLKLVSKLLPKEEAEERGKIIYQSMVPQSDLNKNQISRQIDEDIDDV